MNGNFGEDILLIQELASGGMGEVFLALQVGVGGFEKKVAVKRVFPHLAVKPDFRKMFEREINLGSKLQHPNIVHILRSGEQDGYLYYVMEYVYGTSVEGIIDQAVRAETTIPIPIVLHIISEVAKGLDYAHNLSDDITGKPFNLVHRDISPSNILIGYDGSVKIVDFGIAKASSSTNLTSAGSLKGKFRYMSPELVLNNTFDHRSDLFSLGVVFYEMLAGEHLFKGEGSVEILKDIAVCEIPDVTKVNGTAPVEVINLLHKLLAKEPTNRFQNAEELIRALQQLINRLYPDFSSSDFKAHFANRFAKEISTSSSQTMQKIREVKASATPSSKGSGSKGLTEKVDRRPLIWASVFTTVCLLIAFSWWYKNFYSYSRNAVEQTESPILDIPASFSPAKIPDLRAWFSSETLKLPEQSPISRWESNSGFSLIQENPDHQPRYIPRAIAGKRPALFFDGRNDSLEANDLSQLSLDPKQAMTIVIFAQAQSLPSKSILYSLQEADKDTDVLKLGFYDRTSQVRLNNSLSRESLISPKMNPLDPAVYTTSVYGQEVQVRRNGMLLINFLAPGNPDISLSKILTIGQEFDLGRPSDFYSGFISDILIFNRRLSDRENNLLSSFLRKKII